MAGQCVSLSGSVAPPPLFPNMRGAKLGGGMQGFMPQPLINTNNNSEWVDTRLVVKEAWNNSYRFIQADGAHPKANCTPFRATNNAGDLFSRKYFSTPGPCQTAQSRPNVHGLKSHFGAIQFEDGNGVPAAACNVKFVYDHSDYIRFLKQQAINKNYNDLSFGGNNNSGNQVAYRAARRY